MTSRGCALFDTLLNEQNLTAFSTTSGWPSFRDQEVVWDNVRVLKDGETVSLSGTHLGTYQHSACTVWSMEQWFGTFSFCFRMEEGLYWWTRRVGETFFSDYMPHISMQNAHHFPSLTFSPYYSHHLWLRTQPSRSCWKPLLHQSSFDCWTTERVVPHVHYARRSTTSRSSRQQ